MMETKRRREQRSMLPVHPDAAAIDIGATVHVAAVGPARDPEPVRSFGTFTGDLHRLADWFAGCGIKTIVMESTGVYWIPVFEILEQRGFEVMVVNAREAKHVPGRKTDVSDAEWLQRLHEYGLLRASFRPQPEIAGLRAYLRQRERLLDYAAAHKVLSSKTRRTSNRATSLLRLAASTVARRVGTSGLWYKSARKEVM